LSGYYAPEPALKSRLYIGEVHHARESALLERFNEKARRTIFRARFEACQLGSPQIESELLLLGLLRENKGTLSLIRDFKASEQKILSSIEAAQKQRPKLPISVNLPFTDECKRILGYYAVVEAFRMDNRYIGPEHLLLGILHESGCLAARILIAQGLGLESARKLIFGTEEQPVSPARVAGFAARTLSAFRGTEVRIVEAETSDTLLTYRSRSSVPRIGESILIRDAEGKSQTYRVEEIVWELGFDKAPVLRDVNVRVTPVSAA
jgi:ATP-dependent Clp protease ATP-binding subunit ClpC